MKKFFTFVAALMAVVAVNATVVTLNPSDFSAATQAKSSASVEGVNAELTSGTITDDQIRIFKNQKITISSENEISGIVFTCTANGEAQYGPGCFAAQEGYSYEGKVGVWVGTSKSVTFTASSNQVRASKIEVYLDGEVPEAPEPQEAIPATVAEAIAIGMELEVGKTTDEVYAVTGFVVNAEAYSADYKNQIWWMADDAENTGAQEFEAYSCTVSEDKVIMQVLNGDKVTLTGSITKYKDTKNNDKIIIEIKGGTAVFVSKVDGDHSVDGGGESGGEDVTPAVPEGVLTCAMAQELAATVEDPTADEDEVEVDEVVIRGFVSFCYDLKEGESKQSAWLADLKSAKAGVVQAYYAQVTEAVAKGDYVEVAGKLVKFYKPGKDGKDPEVILEVKNGTMKKVDPNGVENVFTTVKAQKVMINGVLYIVRGNKMYDVRGAQIR